MTEPAVIPLIPWSDRILREAALPIQTINDGIKHILRSMQLTRDHYNGVGLAGPQIGMPMKLVVIKYQQHDHMLVNLEVTPRLKTGGVFDYEGCLSLPGYIGRVPRHDTVQVTAIRIGEDGAAKPFFLVADGMISRIFQHEYDHLNGTLYVNRMLQGEELQKVDRHAAQTSL